MAINTKSRKDLKSYFVKNAIPTEGNFADLVDAQLNQSDDGVFKLAGEPLSVVAASGDQKRTLRLYSNYPAANPDWLISLNPAQNPANAATNRAGFGITDGAGNTRLFIDPGTGNLGVGTNNPIDKLSVQDGDVRIEGGRYRRLKIVSDKYWAGIELVTREQGEAGHPHIDFTHGQLDAPNFGIRVAAETNNALVVSAGDGAATLDVRGTMQATGLVSTPGGLMFEGAVAHIDRDGALYRNTDGQCYLTVDDNLFIRDVGASTWAAQFDTNSGSLNLKGNLTANRIRGLNTLTLNDYRTANPGSNVFLYSPPVDRDAWLYLDSGDTGSNWGIYHRQIDSTVAGLPGNSIGFVGGGQSKLQAYVSLQDGSGFFAGKLAIGSDVSIEGKHAFRGNDPWLRLNQDGAFTNGVHTPGNFAPMALNVGGANDWGNPGAGNAWIKGTLKVFGDIDTDGTVGLGWARTTDNFNAPLRSGFYQKDNPTGDVPDAAHGWVHLIAVRHGNANNHHQLQIASTYAENDKLYFRKIARELTDNNRPAWNEVATVTNGVLRIGEWTLESAGEHLYIKRGSSTVARFSTTWDRFQVYKNIDKVMPYFYFNQDGSYGYYKG